MLSLMNCLRWPAARISLLNQRNPISASTLHRYKSTSNGNDDKGSQKLNNRSTLYYATAAGIFFVGMTYAAVPLYRMFCQVCLTMFTLALPERNFI